MTRLPDQAATYAAERTTLAGGRVELQRAFMAGALAAQSETGAELEALRKFRDFFASRCEGLFSQFGMPAIDLFNATVPQPAAGPDDFDGEDSEGGGADFERGREFAE